MTLWTFTPPPSVRSFLLFLTYERMNECLLSRVSINMQSCLHGLQLTLQMEQSLNKAALMSRLTSSALLSHHKY